MGMKLSNMVLKRIFRPGREEGMGEWRILHNEEINVGDLRFSRLYENYGFVGCDIVW
jgi:hypothetical protein